MLYFHTHSIQWLQIVNLFAVVFPKHWKVTSTDLVNKCFEICSWIPLTMVRFLPLNSALLWTRIAAIAFKCSYTSWIINKILNPLTVCGIRLHLRIPLTNFADSAHNCRFHLHIIEIYLQLRNSEQLAMFACCGIRGATNVPTKFTLQVFVCGIHGNFVSGIYLHFETCLKVCLWNPGT